MKRNNIIIFFAIFLFPTIFANGLSIVGNSSFNINSTVGGDDYIVFTLRNDEAFAFYNITFENNDKIIMQNVSKLDPGYQINISAKIISSTNFNGNLKIKGYYEANLGAQNKTYNITVDYINGINTCDLTIIKGDSIKWINLVSDPIQIVSSYSLFDGTNTIGLNGSGTHKFPIPEFFNYYFERRGYKFTNDCQINVLDDKGLINNPQYDTQISLNIIAKYPPTSLQLTTTETSYSINVYETQEGVLSIKNTGNKTAKNIILTSEWFSFNKNNFDIEPGQSKGVSYIINPIVYFTNQTNKSYNKELKIEGNFPTIRQNFSVFIKYGQIEEGNYTQGMSILEWIRKYCLDNPSDELCGGGTKIIYKSANDSEVNITVAQDQLKSLINMLFEMKDSNEIFKSIVKEELYLMGEKVNSSSINADLTRQQMDSLTKKQEDQNNLIIIISLIIGIIIIVALLSYLVFYYFKENKLKSILLWNRKKMSEPKQ